jgi:hypothetical protein
VDYFGRVEKEFVGGLHANGMAYSWPLIKLVATEERLLFRARFGLGRFAGPWQLDREQVKAVASTGRGSILVFGVEILSPQCDQRWVFNAMTAPQKQLVRALADLGYPARV